MPKLKLFIIKDSGHLPHKEQTEQFNSVFFNKIFNIINKNVTVSQARKIYESNDSIFLDVRTLAEHKKLSIPNSILIPLDQLSFKVDELEKYKTNNIVVYCRVGNRSQFATQFLIGEGFKASNLLGGIVDWTGPVIP